jgi:hypothetical protein
MVSPRSRRRFLSLCAMGSVPPLTGCSATDQSNSTQRTTTAETTQPTDGLVWQKKVQVELTRMESPVLTDILRLQFDRDRNEVFGAFDPEYIETAIDEASVTISSELHDTLTTEFGRVKYKVALGPVNDTGEHLHAQAHRTAFNELPLAGRASVEKFWVEATDDLRVGYVRPTETEPPSQSPSTIDIGRLDLSASYDGY